MVDFYKIRLKKYDNGNSVYRYLAFSGQNSVYTISERRDQKNRERLGTEL